MTTELIIDTASNLAAQTRGEIDSQIATAKAYPRDMAKAKAEIEEMACSDPDTAAQMFYALPRGGKTVEGPSVRLAEVVAYSWQNIRFESKVVDADDSFVTAQATVMDVERNTAGRGECKRRITGRDGKKYNDDMIQVTCNAACAIALREAIFKVVPRIMVDAVWRKAKAVSVGNIKSTIAAASKAMAWFAKSGVVESRVLLTLGRESIADVTADDLGTLRGITQALREQTTTLEEAFPPMLPDEAEVKKIFPDKPTEEKPSAMPAETIEKMDPREGATQEEYEFDAEAFITSIDYSKCRTLGNTTAMHDRLTQELAIALEAGDASPDEASGLRAIITNACDRRQQEIRDKRGPASNKTASPQELFEAQEATAAADV